MYTLIRIEHSNTGLGIFRKDREIRQIPQLKDFFERHHSWSFPTPYAEGLPMNDSYFCAYKSIQEFNRWVTNFESSIITQNNYQILSLTLAQCHIGEHQAIYLKEDIISSIDLSNQHKYSHFLHL